MYMKKSLAKETIECVGVSNRIDIKSETLGPLCSVSINEQVFIKPIGIKMYF